jgi:hypothetical protein
MDALEQIYVLVLRFLHVFGGVFWAGAGLFVAGFLSKAVKASGPDGGKVMGNLLTGTRWNMAIQSASGLTMLSGILLFAYNISRFGGAWGGTAQGIGFSIGGLAGIIAGILGGAVLGRTSKKIAELGAELTKSAGGPPPADKLAEMGALQARMDRFSNISAILLTIAVIMMAISRYLG